VFACDVRPRSSTWRWSRLAATALAAVAYVVWAALDAGLGRSLVAQAASLAAAVTAGAVAYAAGVWALRVPEARQVASLVRARVG
jgi:hypothetical protein